ERLLTSVELTGIWEKKLRDIEHHKYSPSQFLDELKAQVTQIVQDVMHDNSNRQIEGGAPQSNPKGTAPTAGGTSKTTKKAPNKRPAKTKKVEAPLLALATTTNALSVKEGDICPVCHQGHVIKGKSAWGCSRWQEGCDFRIPF
ncbi:MAG: DNA topoisomerase III, partial [Prevotella sp.]|nr:DNA topoisomerase III [Prevotella sp.]